MNSPRRLTKPGRALLPALMVLLLLISAQAQGLELAWNAPQPSGLSGVSLALVEMPQGGWRAWWMRGREGMWVASSPDGLAWQSLHRVGIENPPDDPHAPFNPWVLVTQEGSLRMIYEVQDQEGNRRLYHALSSDGERFTYEGVAISGGDQDRAGPNEAKPGPGQPNPVFLSVPSGLRLADGSLRMYFVTQGDRIGSAISLDDGLTWQRDPGHRLLNAVDPAVMALPGGGWRMFYTDWAPPYRTRRILYADSADGLAFTPQETIIQAGQEEGMLVDPELLSQEGQPLCIFFSQAQGQDEVTIFRDTAPAGYDQSLFPLVQPAP